MGPDSGAGAGAGADARAGASCDATYPRPSYAHALILLNQEFKEKIFSIEEETSPSPPIFLLLLEEVGGSLLLPILHLLILPLLLHIRRDIFRLLLRYQELEEEILF